MLFIINDRTYAGETAVEIVRQLERDEREYENSDASIRAFLLWALERLADRIPPRDLDVSPSLDDETISFNFLCLLDACRIAEFDEQSGSAPDPAASEKAAA